MTEWFEHLIPLKLKEEVASCLVNLHERGGTATAFLTELVVREVSDLGKLSSFRFYLAWTLSHFIGVVIWRLYTNSLAKNIHPEVIEGWGLLPSGKLKVTFEISVTSS